jgi:hypothetical protein
MFDIVTTPCITLAATTILSIETVWAMTLDLLIHMFLVRLRSSRLVWVESSDVASVSTSMEGVLVRLRDASIGLDEQK